MRHLTSFIIYSLDQQGQPYTGKPFGEYDKPVVGYYKGIKERAFIGPASHLQNPRFQEMIKDYKQDCVLHVENGIAYLVPGDNLTSLGDYIGKFEKVDGHYFDADKGVTYDDSTKSYYAVVR
jgi:hypothetical protein